MEDIKQYLKELESLKNSGLLDDESISEIDSLVDELKDLEEKNITENNNNSDYEFNIPIKYVNLSENPDPLWAKKGDSGFDLRANSDGIIKPLDRLLIPTGLFFEVPIGYDIEIKSRSGLALKHGIGVLTGTIDQNYRGELKVLLFNISNENFEFKKGDRIAQAVVRPRVSTEFGKMVRLNSIDELSETNRNFNGFGSTGKS